MGADVSSGGELGIVWGIEWSEIEIAFCGEGIE
jgi:hypothetical protein